MTDKIRTIRLYGQLGARFGRVHRLAVASAAEAAHALGVLLPGFRQFLAQASDRGMDFAVFAGRRNLAQDQLGDPPGSDDIRIAPILRGAKNAGLFNVVLGGALIVAAGFLTAGAGWTLAGAAFGSAAGITASMGFSLVLGGVSTLLAGQTKLSTGESAENTPSYGFAGIVQTQAQGGCVPVCYGDMLVGSAVVSSGLYAEDQQ
jgi:predicted phage tail protein